MNFDAHHNLGGLKMQFYLIKRGEQTYQAGSLEILKQWASQGRVKKSDLIKGANSENWILAEDFDALVGMFEQKKSEPAWLIVRKDQQYPVSDFQKLEEWARNAKLSPLDDLLEIKTQKKIQIKDHPHLMSLIPKASPQPTPSQIQAQVQVQAQVDLTTEVSAQESAKNQQSNQESENQPSAQSQLKTPIFSSDLFEPIYDFIRIFLVCKPIHYFDVFKKPCFIPTLNLDVQGLDKMAIYQEFLSALQKHFQEEVCPSQSKCPSDHAQNFEDWIDLFQNLIFILDQLLLKRDNQEISLLEDQEHMVELEIEENIRQMVSVMKKLKNATL
jgi:hypothetical protein